MGEGVVWWYRKGKGGLSLTGVVVGEGWMGIREVLDVVTEVYD